MRASITIPRKKLHERHQQGDWKCGTNFRHFKYEKRYNVLAYKYSYIKKLMLILQNYEIAEFCGVKM